MYSAFLSQKPGFQPTRPLRGATVCPGQVNGHSLFQPTRPLRGATISSLSCWTPSWYFNPRAPCGARPPYRFGVNSGRVFQPTRPLRGATQGVPAERDIISDFNPRAPCGARPFAPPPCVGSAYFNPRAPCGARQQKCTNHYAHFCDNRQISDAFAQNAACQGILLLFDAGKPCGFWVRTAQVISAHLCFAL